MHTLERGFLPAFPANISVPASLSRFSELVFWMDTTTRAVKLVSHNVFKNATANNYALCTMRRSFSQTHGPYRTLSGDGRFAVFHSRASNLVDERVDGIYDNVFVYDVLNEKAQLISGSRMQATPGNVTRSTYSLCRAASIASNATTVAFVCRRAMTQSGMYVHDTVACDFSEDDLAPLNCTILSVNASGEPSLLQFAAPELTGAPSLSSNGLIAAFSTSASDMIVDPNFISPLFPQSARIVVRNRATNQTIWAARRDTPDNAQEWRPWLTANGSRVFWEGNSESYLPGENSTSIAQIYYEDIATRFRARPVPWPCPYPTAQECYKVSLQLEADILDVASSSDAEVVAFGTYQPDFMEPEEVVYRGFVCAARICNRPPNGVYNDVGVHNGFLPPDQRNGTFIYLRSTLEEVSDMVQIDRRNRSAEIMYPFASLVAVSPDGRYIVHRAQNRIGTLPQHTGRYCVGSLYVYDTIRREHELLLKGENNTCVGNVSMDPTWLSGSQIVFTTRGAISNFAGFDQVHSGSNVVSYDYDSQVTLLESTNATLVEVRNTSLAGNGELLGYATQQAPVPFACDHGIISGDGRWVVLRCFPSLGPAVVFIRDRTDPEALLVPLSVNATGGLWEADCLPKSITDTGRFIAFECRGWATGGASVVGPTSPWVGTALFEIAVILMDRNAVNYAQRVYVIPPGRPLASCGPGAHRVYGPVIPRNPTGRFFIIVTYQAPLTGEDFTVVSLIWYLDTPLVSSILFPDKNSPVGVASISADGSKVVAVTTSYLLAPYDVNGRTDAYVVNLNNVTTSNAMLVSARDNYFTSSLPAFNCSGLRPQPRFECINGTWTLRPSNYSNTIILRSDVDVTNGTNAAAAPNATVLVAGAVRIGCNGSFAIGMNTSILLADQFTICGSLSGFLRPNGFLIETLSCANLGGTIDVTVDTQSISNNGSVAVGIIGYESLCANQSGIPQVTVRTDNIPRCKIVSQNLESRSTGLYVIFTFTDSADASCQPPNMNGATDDGNGISVVAWAVPVAIILGLALITVIVIMTVPSIRKKVFPFLSRRSKDDDKPLQADEHEMDSSPTAPRKKTRAQAPSWTKSVKPTKVDE